MTTREFGPYTILEDLAQGGMGSVHVARRYGSSKPCVLKKPLAHAPELLRRFRREANLCTHLDHANIARVLDAGTEDETFYIAFEMIEGQTLARLLKRVSTARRWLTNEAAVWILDEVLSGLAYAHDATDPEGRPLSIVHRDLSPSNVMISYEGAVKIIDFGVAIGAVDEHRTLPGHFVGTVRYMSPEQAMSNTIDRRSDLYTVGVLLWELLARRRFVPKGTIKEILGTIAARPVPDVDSAPPALMAIARRALAKSPDERFQSAPEMQAALRDALPTTADGAQAELVKFLSTYYAAQRADAQRLAQTAAELSRGDLVEAAQTSRTKLATAGQEPDDFVTHAALIAPTATARPLSIPGVVPIDPETADTKATAPIDPLRPSVIDADTIRIDDERPPAPPPEPRKKRRRRSRRTLYLGVALIGATALAAVALVDSQTKRPVPTPIAPPPPPPPSTPGVTARSMAPIVEDEPPPPVPPPPVTKSVPKKTEPPPPAVASDLAAIAEVLDSLDASPKDGALLLRAHDAIAKAADRRLPPTEAKQLRARIRRALRAGDHRMLREAYEKLRASP